MKYCCTQFRHLIDNIGGKGFSIVHAVKFGNRVFCLQSRPFDMDVYEYHSQLIDGKTTKWPRFRNISGEERSIGLVINQEISFCPHCGKSLIPLILDQLNDFDQLAIEQSSFWNFK